MASFAYPCDSSVYEHVKCACCPDFARQKAIGEGNEDDEPHWDEVVLNFYSQAIPCLHLVLREPPCGGASYKAIELLKRLSMDEGYSLILEVLQNSPDGNVVEAAITALGEVAYQPAEDILTNMLDAVRGDAGRCTVILAALREFRSSKAINKIGDMAWLADVYTIWEKALSMLLALAEEGNTHALNRFVSIIKSHDSSYRCRRALEMLTDASRDVLLSEPVLKCIRKARDDPRAEVRASALELLMAIKQDSATPEDFMDTGQSPLEDEFESLRIRALASAGLWPFVR